jgi:hypothetical protein
MTLPEKYAMTVPMLSTWKPPALFYWQLIFATAQR